jgi:hypothetical protein
MMRSDAIGVIRYDSPADFRTRAEAWLMEREAENNLILALARQLEESAAGYEKPIYFATIERNSKILGCVFRTPPFNLGITRLPMEAVAPLFHQCLNCFRKIEPRVGDIYVRLHRVYGYGNVLTGRNLTHLGRS